MKKTVVIVGGGPAALLLAAFLDEQQFDCKIYERNKTVGRKFLVAGKGGFNLTHSEAMEHFVERYTPASFLKEALASFSNEDLRDWLAQIGIPTFVGSSQRVFPEKGIKPIEVLNAILIVLEGKKVKFNYLHTWTGWTNENDLVFNNNLVVKSDYVVFALGGGSWKITGSKGEWLEFFAKKGVSSKAFVASNCAFKIDWSADFLVNHEGKPLKNIAVHCGDKSKKGELVITKFGVEGGAIYALSPIIQNDLQTLQKSAIFIDLKPNLSFEKVLQKIKKSNYKKTSEILRKDLKMSSLKVALLKSILTKDEFLDYSLLAKKIKRLPLLITASAPLDEAISTSGGISLDAVNQYFELKQLKNTFCIGEMLDWNAPTGGYLLQACFSMGAFLAKKLAEKS